MGNHILIVDDDEDARRILSEIVAALDMAPETAADGREALDRVKHKLPDLILLDLMMPGMDGFSFLATLRANPRTRYLSVIVVTACTPEQIDMLKLPGVTAAVRKGNALSLIPHIKEALDTNPPLSSNQTKGVPI